MHASEIKTFIYLYINFGDKGFIKVKRVQWKFAQTVRGKRDASAMNDTSGGELKKHRP